MYFDAEIKASISSGRKLVVDVAKAEGLGERRTAAEVEEGMEVADSGFEVRVELFPIDVLHRS